MKFDDLHSQPLLLVKVAFQFEACRNAAVLRFDHREAPMRAETHHSSCGARCESVTTILKRLRRGLLHRERRDAFNRLTAIGGERNGRSARWFACAV